MKGPGALARALSGRVANPNVCKSAELGSGREAVVPASAHTEPFHRHIFSGKDHIDSIAGSPTGSKLENVRIGKRFAERVRLVKDLFAEGERRKPGLRVRVVFLGGFKPSRHRRFRFGAGCERGDEISEDCTLRRCEFAVPDEIDGNFAGKERTFVIPHAERYILY